MTDKSAGTAAGKPQSDDVTCDWCRRRMTWLVTRTGVRKPFDLETIPWENDFGRNGYVLRKTYPGDPLFPHPVATPVTDVAERHLANIKRVIMPHRCAEYREAHPPYGTPRPFKSVLAAMNEEP